MTLNQISATVSGVITRTEDEASAHSALKGSTCELPIKTQPEVAAALVQNEPGAHIHLAGRRTKDAFIAEHVLAADQASKHVGEITRILKNGTIRAILTDGRGCTCVPSTVKARQTSAPLRPGTKVCMIGFVIEPTTAAGSNPDRIFLDAFYVRKVR